MHLDFSTFCMLSAPGFLVGIMIGKFLEGSRGRKLRQRLGVAWKIIGWIMQLGYFLTSLITLGIIFVFLIHSNKDPRPISFWVTILVGSWIIYNLVYDMIETIKGEDCKI